MEIALGSLTNWNFDKKEYAPADGWAASFPSGLAYARR